MKRIFLMLLLLCSNVWAVTFTDLKFGQAQIADSQWNVQACTQTATCEIYSKNPGTAYKIPWWSGQLSWAAGDYVAFVLTGDVTNPYNAIQYSANGTQKDVMGTGHIINMGTDYFFFVGNDNDTGQLFSMTNGFNNSDGVTWTGTLNPTTAEVDAYAANGSTTPLVAGETATPTQPVNTLCCGGSAAQFNADAGNTAKVMSFINRTTNDSKVFIEQIGSNNIITVNQSGTQQNYTEYYGYGYNNEIAINQSGNSTTQANYIDSRVVGNSNKITTTQQSTGGAKGVFVTVNNNNNIITIQQKDGGSHYANVSVSGGNKEVDILQQGSASHMANVTLTGPQPASIGLTQSGSTQQFYTINYNCATAGGCAKITVNQGQ